MEELNMEEKELKEWAENKAREWFQLLNDYLEQHPYRYYSKENFIYILVKAMYCGYKHAEEKYNTKE